MLIHKIYFKNVVLPAAGAMVLALAGSAGAAMVSVTDGDANNFGDTAGIAIDFNTDAGNLEVPTRANYDPDLVPGTTYSVDSVTVFKGEANEDSNVYLGVYRTLTQQSGSDGVSDFLGVSNETIDFSLLDTNAGTNEAIYTFSDITVVADAVATSGTGVLYFVFQSGTDAVTDVGDSEVGIRRIDEGNNGAFINHLAAILQPSGGSDVRLSRAPEYEATVSVFVAEEGVPEPGSLLGLLAGMGVFGLRRRRGAA